MGLLRTMARRSGEAEASTGRASWMVEFSPLAPVALASTFSRPGCRSAFTSALTARSALASALRASCSAAVMAPDSVGPLPCRFTWASTLPTKSGDRAFRSTPRRVLARVAPPPVS